jgi:hypothetical protein
MRVKVERVGAVLRVEVEERETAEEALELTERILAERERHGLQALLIVSRHSRPLFKLDDYGFSRVMERLRAVPGMRVALVAGDEALHAAHQYAVLRAAQRGVTCRAFLRERDALAWLRGA